MSKRSLNTTKLHQSLAHHKKRAANALRVNHPHAHDFFEKVGINPGKIRDHAAKMLVSGALASSVVLSTPVFIDIPKDIVKLAELPDFEREKLFSDELKVHLSDSLSQPSDCYNIDMKLIVLASSSPRRKKLLEEAGYTFIIDPSDFDESKVSKDNPHEMVKHLSLEKAREVAKRHSNSIIIGADTTVVCNEQLLEKPKDNADAKRMLQFLSGKTHYVITGITVINTDNNKEITDFEESKVTLKKLTEKEIDDYVKTGDPMDKAGAYAIQEGLSQYFVEKIDGDYTNIVGLPIPKLKDIITQITK